MATGSAVWEMFSGCAFQVSGNGQLGLFVWACCRLEQVYPMVRALRSQKKWEINEYNLCLVLILSITFFFNKIV